ncbi:WD repeat-containing protein 64-like [Rana temporaria]|uniref:WD repeat-containing protein 64-like n=1 Tax=Rana temporaria TaxID=8407 RepID=UPI001AAE0FAA|nr:WD repeat-containing protein 64-like [Rana temporaria]
MTVPEKAVIKYDEFHEAVQNLIGQDVKRKDSAALFEKITKYPDAPVNWNEGTAWFQSCDIVIHMKKVVAVSEESLVFWDYKWLGKPEGSYTFLQPMKHRPKCVCAVNSQEDSEKNGILVGDDAGFITLFSIGKYELNKCRTNLHLLSQPGLLHSGNFEQVRRKLHSDWVIKLKYIQELKFFASCSEDSEHSLVLDEVERITDKRPVRCFSVKKGITAFAFSVTAKRIVTGGPDKLIRLWNPLITTKPMEELRGHRFTIADIAVNDQDQQVISVCTHREYRVWDIQTQALLEIFCDTQQGPGDLRINSMVFDDGNSRLLAGSSVLDIWPLTWNKKKNPHSHDCPINALVYNPIVHKVLSICSGSIVKVWEMETGAQVYKIKNAHGPTIEVTTAALDISGFHFATGAIDGSVKIWKFENGSQVKVLKPNKEGNKDEERGICQLSYKISHDNQHIIIALDKSGNIKIIQGKEDDPELFVATEFGQDTDVWHTTLQSMLDMRLDENVMPPDGPEEQIVSLRRTSRCFDAVKLERCFLMATGSTHGEISLYKEMLAVSLGGLEERLAAMITRSMPGKKRTRSPSPKGVSSDNEVLSPEELEDQEDQLDQNLEGSDIEESTVEEPFSASQAESLWIQYLTDMVRSAFKMPLPEPQLPEVSSLGSLKAPLSNAVFPVHPLLEELIFQDWGDLISEELLFTKHPPRPITALCSDKCGNLIITGNAEGYIRLWKLYKIQEADKEIIMMLNEELCWRAHPMKITGLFYEDNNNIVVSASEDDSIRIWHATRGAYIGHFGQEGAYKLIDPPAMTLPRDIKELPVKATSTIYDELEPSLIYDRDRDGSHRGPAEKYMGIKYYKYLTRSSSACSMQPENLEDSSKWLGKPLFPSYYRRQSNQFSMFADNMPCLVSSSSPANPDIALKTVNEKPE